MTPGRRFRKHDRLGLQRRFEAVLADRCRAGDRALVVYVAPNGLAWSRIGIRVSRRVGTAVERAYVRRRVREAFRNNRDRLPTGYDIVCIPRAPAKRKSVDLAAKLVHSVQAAVRESRGKRKRKTESRGTEAGSD